MKELIVNEEGELYTFLRDNLSGSKNNIKSLLSKEMISVNGKIVTKYNYLLKVNDKITVGAKYIFSPVGNIKILYEDKNIIVVDKPSGLLTVATEEDRDNENTLFSIILKYIKKKNSNGRLFVVHRLDKDTSGILLFSKDEKLKDKLQNDWNNIATRIYYAVVYGKTKEEETLSSYLKEDDNLVTFSSKEGKLAITNYKRIKCNDDYSLLEIEIKTGRRNQIRVHLKEIGHPIVGDSKYGYKNKSIKRMLLHASKLIIKYPIDNQVLSFESKPSSYFDEFIK